MEGTGICILISSPRKQQESCNFIEIQLRNNMKVIGLKLWHFFVCLYLCNIFYVMTVNT
jgi:hypothetical protein